MKQVLTFLLLLSCIPTWSQPDTCSITLTDGTPVGDTLEVCLSDTLTLTVECGYSNNIDFCWTLNGDTVSSENCVETPTYSLQALDTLELVVVGMQNGSNSNTCCTDTVQIIPVTCGCTDSTACNYDSLATEEDDSCLALDALDVCGGDCAEDADEDGICDDVDECVGTLDALDVCNGDCAADVDDDGVCDTDEIPGCTDPLACNFDSLATDDDGSCAQLDAINVCGGDCEADQDNDEICDDEDPCVGQYDALGVCNGGCPSDFDNDGVCDNAEILGCTDTTACNFNPLATTEDGSCQQLDALNECGGTCSADEDGDGICDDVDDCVGELDVLGDCNGGCQADTDGDGICDTDEVAGCTDQNACNYNPDATDDDDGSCTFTDGICDTCVDGIVVENDTDNDGICDADEVAGCTDSLACNYDETATDAGDCTFTDGICQTCEEGLIVGNDDDGDGVCNADEVIGCQDVSACNFDSLATDSDSTLCVFALQDCESCLDGDVTLNDADGDGICDGDEIIGCTDSTACNFNSAATDSDSTLCTFVDGLCETCVDGEVVDNDADGDGICDADEIPGCTDALACNYDSLATDSALCIFRVDFAFDSAYTVCSGDVLELSVPGTSDSIIDITWSGMLDASGIDTIVLTGGIDTLELSVETSLDTLTCVSEVSIFVEFVEVLRPSVGGESQVCSGVEYAYTLDEDDWNLTDSVWTVVNGEDTWYENGVGLDVTWEPGGPSFMTAAMSHVSGCTTSVHWPIQILGPYPAEPHVFEVEGVQGLFALAQPYALMRWGYTDPQSNQETYVVEDEQYHSFDGYAPLNNAYWVEVGTVEACLYRHYLNEPLVSGVEETLPGFKVWPVPSNGRIEVDATAWPMGTEWGIWDGLGRLCAQGMAAQGTYSLMLDGLPHGKLELALTAPDGTRRRVSIVHLP